MTAQEARKQANQNEKRCASLIKECINNAIKLAVERSGYHVDTRNSLLEEHSDMLQNVNVHMAVVHDLQSRGYGIIDGRSTIGRKHLIIKWQVL